MIHFFSFGKYLPGYQKSFQSLTLDTLGLGKLLEVLRLFVLIKLIKISVLLEKLPHVINTVEKLEVESLNNHTKFGTTVNF